MKMITIMKKRKKNSKKYQINFIVKNVESNRIIDKSIVINVKGVFINLIIIGMKIKKLN